MSVELFQKIDGSVKPDEPGEYITNLGNLYFDGESFVVSGHSNRRVIRTVIDWWFKQVPLS